jgi:ADP-ribose pyrophosphatase YjhB (NUDIX family)
MVRTRGVIFDAQGRLLVQHHPGSGSDFYRLPGGGVRFREKLEDCLIREVREETGLEVAVDRLLWVRDFLADVDYHSVEVFFLAHVTGGTFSPTPEDGKMELLFKPVEELEQVVFYPRAFLPKLKQLRSDRLWMDANPYVRAAH